MKSGNQGRLKKLAMAGPQRVYVFFVPPGRSNEDNVAEANKLLEGMGLPPNKHPMIFEFEKQTETSIGAIDDFGAMLAEIMEENTSRARRH